MIKRFPGPIVTAVTLAGVVLITFLATAGRQEESRARAAVAEKAKAAPAPRAADGKVDFSGIWGADRNFIFDIHDALKNGEELPLQPWATHLFFLFEGNIHSYRQIFLDGRKHPEDPNPTWYGHSIGRWEGDTLVVDSVGFNDRFWFDFAGHPHTEQLHIIERYRRPDVDRLDYEITVEDPGAYTKPFTLYGHSTYQHGDELMEYICNENNKDLPHIVGKDPRNRYFKK